MKTSIPWTIWLPVIAALVLLVLAVAEREAATGPRVLLAVIALHSVVSAVQARKRDGGSTSDPSP